MLPSLQRASSIRAVIVARVMVALSRSSSSFSLAISVALCAGLVSIGCGGHPPIVKTPNKPPPMSWSACPHPVFGVGCELPDEWMLNESESSSFANPKPPGDDAVVLFVHVRQGDARGPDEILGGYLPLRDVHYSSRDRDVQSPAGAKLSEGSAAVDGGEPVRFWAYQMLTARGAVMVAVVLKTTASARSGAVVQRIAASLRIADPPASAETKVLRDLAGRPLDGSAKPKKQDDDDDEDVAKPAGKESGS